MRISELVNAASLVHEMKNGHPNYFPGIQPDVKDNDRNQKRARLTAENFTPENLARLQEQFEKGKMVAVQFSVELEPRTGEPFYGSFEVFLKRQEENQAAGISQYIRNGIIVTEQNAGISGKFGYCFVITDDEEMSNFLAAAEGPAHTNWLIGKLNESGSYKSDWPLRFVMEAAGQLHRILTGEDQEKNEIENFAEDIFSIEKPGADAGPEPKKKSPIKSQKPSPPHKPKPVEMIRVEKREDSTGFAINPVKNLQEVMDAENAVFPLRVDVVAAYLSVKGNSRSFKDYTRIDFDFSDTITVEAEPAHAVHIAEKNENRLTIEISQPEFEVKVSGFDKHRDLLVRTQLQLLDSEVAS